MVEAERTDAAVSGTDRDAARRLVVVSGLFLVVQVAAADYGTTPGDSTPAVLWLLVGLALLWLVLARRSMTARGIVIVLSSVGAVLYGLSAAESGRSAVLLVAFAGQAVPLLMPAVRRHMAADER